MAFDVVQRRSNLPGGSGTNYSLAYNSTTAGGSLLVVMVVDQVAANVTAPTDSAGNTYVQAGSEFQYGSNYISIWYAKNAAANAGTVTVHLTSSASGRVVAIYEIPGADTTAPLDTTKTGTSGANVNTFASAQFTIASSEIICAMMVYVGTDPAAGTGFTLNFYGGFYSDEYGVFSSNQTANGTFPTTGANYGILAASFKAAPAAGGQVPYTPWPQLGPICAQINRAEGPHGDRPSRFKPRLIAGGKELLVPDRRIVRPYPLRKAA